MIRATNITMTCAGCPSQWEGQTDDGRWYYIRYRHGSGYIAVGDSVSDAIMGEIIAAFAPPGANGFHGVLSTAEMQRLTVGAVDWSGTEVIPGAEGDE